MRPGGRAGRELLSARPGALPVAALAAATATPSRKSTLHLCPDVLPICLIQGDARWDRLIPMLHACPCGMKLHRGEGRQAGSFPNTASKSDCALVATGCVQAGLFMQVKRLPFNALVASEIKHGKSFWCLFFSLMPSVDFALGFMIGYNF